MKKSKGSGETPAFGFQKTRANLANETEFGHAFFAVAVEASLSHTDTVSLKHW
jgi:hypothetical protein